ncbi:hypothetical protein CRENBAI_010013 [Crenichthys baileyi]|uniref:Uncharacterized protein n=1 Tax=Crenichthys baileyi TaxID=28760 RepID=A0AAV9RFR7_9TELE
MSTSHPVGEEESQPTKGDVPHNVDGSQDGHEQSCCLVADTNAHSIRHEIDKGQTAAAGQKEEGQSQTQKVWQEQEVVLRLGQEAGTEAVSPLQPRSRVSMGQGQGE